MDIIRFTLDKLPEPTPGLTLALGEFDGVHLGHRRLLLEAAMSGSGPAGVLLFALPFPGKGEKVLMTLEDKLVELGKDNVDVVYVLEGGEEVFGLSPEAFIETVLKPLGTKEVVVGPDYRFGKDAQGDVELLKQHFKVLLVPFATIDEEKISTSAIRRFLKEGDVEKARRYLGRPYRIKGKTVPGKKLGRTLGFPTLNLSAESPYQLPGDGVYLALAFFKGRFFRAIVDIGNKPTVSSNNGRTVEAHLLGYEGNEDYDFTLYLEFLAFRRKEMAFASQEELIEQLKKDKAWALSYDD